jgi:hypothetical protein
MKAVLIAAAFAAGLAPLPALAQPHDDWQPLVKMCRDYAKANPPPHANGPVSSNWLTACVTRNYFPNANGSAIGMCLIAGAGVAFTARDPTTSEIEAAVNCLAAKGWEEQHGWR